MKSDEVKQLADKEKALAIKHLNELFGGAENCMNTGVEIVVEKIINASILYVSELPSPCYIRLMKLISTHKINERVIELDGFESTESIREHLKSTQYEPDAKNWRHMWTIECTCKLYRHHSWGVAERVVTYGCPIHDTLDKEKVIE